MVEMLEKSDRDKDWICGSLGDKCVCCSKKDVMFSGLSPA